MPCCPAESCSEPWAMNKWHWTGLDKHMDMDMDKNWLSPTTEQCNWYEYECLCFSWGKCDDDERIVEIIDPSVMEWHPVTFWVSSRSRFSLVQSGVFCLCSLCSLIVVILFFIFMMTDCSWSSWRHVSCIHVLLCCGVVTVVSQWLMVINGYQVIKSTNKLTIYLSIISGQSSVVSGRQWSPEVRGHHCFESETLLEALRLFNINVTYIVYCVTVISYFNLT